MRKKKEDQAGMEEPEGGEEAAVFMRDRCRDWLCSAGAGVT